MKNASPLHAIAVILFAMILAVGCSPSDSGSGNTGGTGGGSADTPREVRSGVSAPKVKNHGVLAHDINKPLAVAFWCAADAEPQVVMTVNGSAVELTKGARTDVETNYPEYSYHSGYSVKVPPASLQTTGNKIVITINGKVHADLNFSISQ